jgi:hypothetical protein
VSKYEPPMSEGTKAAWMVIIFIGFIAVLLAVWWGKSTMEAAAYNRITGSDVSTWDAMWVELRVQDGPARK